MTESECQKVFYALAELIEKRYDRWKRHQPSWMHVVPLLHDPAVIKDITAKANVALADLEKHLAANAAPPAAEVK